MLYRFHLTPNQSFRWLISVTHRVQPAPAHSNMIEICLQSPVSLPLKGFLLNSVDALEWPCSPFSLVSFGNLVVLRLAGLTPTSPIPSAIRHTFGKRRVLLLLVISHILSFMMTPCHLGFFCFQCFLDFFEFSFFVRFYGWIWKYSQLQGS